MDMVRITCRGLHLIMMGQRIKAEVPQTNDVPDSVLYFWGYEKVPVLVHVHYMIKKKKCRPKIHMKVEILLVRTPPSIFCTRNTITIIYMENIKNMM